MTKSREAALAAVQAFNNPLITFRAEIFIVLMHIAWTYLLHAHYHRKGVEYRRHRKQEKRRKFERTKYGAFTYWSLLECVESEHSPLDGGTKNNLLFLMGLRNEIEHRRTPPLDDEAGPKFQACCLNYKHYMEELFGKKYAEGAFLEFSLQFSPISSDQIKSVPDDGGARSRAHEFMHSFESGLSDEEAGDFRYSCKVRFVAEAVNSEAQADKVIRFEKADSSRAGGKDAERVVVKEIDRRTYLPTEIVDTMTKEGFVKFNMHHHTLLWKHLDAKNPGKGYGGLRGGKIWFWHGRWVDEVREHCRRNAETYRENS